MSEWWKYFFGFLGVLVTVLGTILVTWMKIKHDKNEKNKDRKHEIKKIKLKSREDIALMSLLVLLERRINRKRIKLKNNGNHIKEWKKLRNKNKEKKWKKK